MSDDQGPDLMAKIEAKAEATWDVLSRPFRSDPCRVFLEKYEKCVAMQTDGLSEGNECGTEANFYKQCRKENKPKKS